jgi:hypothetical protein
LAKALINDRTCGLPQRIQNITRQDVSVTVLDSFEGIDEGHTGIWVVDSWIASVTKPLQFSSVTTPETHRRRRQTSP